MLLAPLSGAWAQQNITINNNSQIGARVNGMDVCGNGAITDPTARGDCNNLDPAMDGNRVFIYAPVTASPMHVTGRLDESASAATTGSGNSVALTADIGGVFYGAYAHGTEDGVDATLTGNKVMIDRTAAYSEVTAYGGYALAGADAAASATDNQALLSSNGLREAIGGAAICERDCTTEASGNTVSVTDGTFGNWGFLVGGLAEVTVGSMGSVATASNNTVSISNSTVDTGGRALNGGDASCFVYCTDSTASGNTVQISGGTVSNSPIVGGSVLNGDSATASDNTVEISGAAQIGAGVSLAGGQITGASNHPTSTGNTLKLGVRGVTVDSVSDFQNMDFDLPAALGNHGVMLISRQAVDVSGVTLSVGVEPGSPLQVGNEIVLIEGPDTPAPSITGTLATNTITSLTTGYAFELVSVAGGSDENQLIVRVTNSPLLSFYCGTACDLPASTTGTAITSRDVSSFAAGGATPYTFTATGLPAGVSISTAGVISGTPTTVGAAGTATITVTDSTAPTAQTASVTIQYGAVTAPSTPLSFTHSTSYDIPASTVGTAITPIDVGVGAAGGTQPYTFSASGLPAGLSIDSATGVISGTPTTAGAGGSVTITVTDAASESESITISYGAITQTLAFTGTHNIPGGMVGTAITSVNVASGVTGGQGPYAFSATGLPLGLGINSATGVISGTPSASGPADTATITVTDSSTPTPQTAHITISYGAFVTQLTYLTRTTYNIPPSTVGVAIVPVDVSDGASGGTPPYTFSSTDLPAWLSISPAGVISGAPTAPGPAGAFTVTVTDSGTPTPQTAQITVHYGATSPPTITVGPQSGTLTPGGAAGAVTYHVTVTGIPDGGPYTVTLAGEPAGVTADDLTLTDGAGTLTLNAPAGLPAGSHTVTMTINGVTSGAFTFTVGALPSASAAAIPTLGQWGLALLAFLVLAGGAAVRRRRVEGLALRVER